MRFFPIALLFPICSFSLAAQQFGSAENLGPAIPTPQTVVEAMLEAGHLKAGETLYDLGSGDGRILITAVQQYGAKAVGIEIRPDLCEQAKARIHSLGLDDRISIIQGSVLRVDLSPADVVTMFFLTTSNERLRPALEKWLKPNARVVSNQFPIKGWKPDDVVRVKAGSMEHTIYVYRMGHTK
jgi:predicted RNA methylase